MPSLKWQAGLLLIVLCKPAKLVLSIKLRNSTSKPNEDYHVKLDNYNNVQYSASFTLGNQILPVIYDTGSFEIIVLSTLCKSCQQRGHVMYNRLNSSSFVKGEGVVAEHLFVSGPIISEKGYETVHIGPPESPYFVGYFPFWQVVSHELDIWNGNAHFSGIVGMGHPNPIPEGYSAEGDNDRTLIAGMGVQSFALCLEREQSGSPGWLSLGPDNDQMVRSGLFSAVPVIGQVHWGVKMTSVHVPNMYSVMEENTNSCPNGIQILDAQACATAAAALGLAYEGAESYSNVPQGCYRYMNGKVYLNTHRSGGRHSGDAPICKVVDSDLCKPSCGAIIDSGTSLIAVPPSASRLAYQLSQMIASDCSNLHLMPTIKMSLGDVMIELPPKAYVVQVKRDVPANSTIRKRMVGSSEKSCRAAFMSIDKDSKVGPVWILGMPFLRYYHTIFNRASKEIYIRRASPTCKMPSHNAVTRFNISNSSRINGSAQQDHLAEVFTAADYQPTEVDLNDVRLPAWAGDESEIRSQVFRF